ncbi:MAG: methylenetetrahydrofolate reductase [Candidatus Dormibacteraceae bacterium]
MARITDLLAGGPTFSFEFFPPKDDAEQERLQLTIRELEPLAPSFVSVTYRGGATSRERTTRVVLDLKATTSITPMPHLTCVAHARTELKEIVSGFHDAGLENLLALGGDRLIDQTEHFELQYADELVRLARDLGFESIGVAAHPAGHPRSPNLDSDRDHLAAKLALADFAITQFFFTVDEYERLREQLAARGVLKPIIAGIMPITSLPTIRRMAELSGYSLPRSVALRLERAGEDAVEIRRVGIEMAGELCRDLLDVGVPGLHFYTLNRSTATRDIYRSLGFAQPAL